MEVPLEKNFTFRFYQISRDNAQIPSMVDSLRHIAETPKGVAREKQLAGDYIVRLENFESDGPDAVVGEILRCQGTNFPSELSGDDRKSLTAERLGHSIVFRLNHSTGKFGVQYDPRVVSPGRILEYIASYNSSAIYSLDPIINKSAWAKFNSGDTRKLIFKVANPKDLSGISGDGNAAAVGLQNMGDAHGAPYIEVTMSMGTRKGALKKVGGLAKQLASLAGVGGSVEKIRARTIVNDIAEDIDLIEDRVVARDTLDIDDRDPEKNWEIKSKFLSNEMKKMVG